MSKTALCWSRSSSNSGCRGSVATATNEGCWEGAHGAPTHCHVTRRPSRWKDTMSPSKSQVRGANVPRKSTPKMKSKQPSASPTQVMEKGAPLMTPLARHAVAAGDHDSELVAPPVEQAPGGAWHALDEGVGGAGVQQGEEALALDRHRK